MSRARLPEVAPIVTAADRFDPASVLDVVPRWRAPTGEHYERPMHLAPYAELLDRAVLQGGVRAVVACPNQVGKSVTSISALAFAHLKRPGLAHMFLSYGKERSAQARRDLIDLCEDLGIKTHNSGDLTWLDDTTTVRWSSCSGAVIGFQCNGLMLADDIVRDDAAAHSASQREKLNRWFMRSALSRLSSKRVDGTPAASVVLVATRQHVHDLSGKMIETPGWEHLRIPALCDDEKNDPLGRKLGESIWPARKPASEYLAFQKNDPTGFATLAQGLPRADAAILFGDPVRFERDAMPKFGRNVWGVDLSYSGKQTADWNIMIGGLVDAQGRLWIHTILRQKEQPEAFIDRAAAAFRTKPGTCVFRYGTNEESACRELERAGIRLQRVKARETKMSFARESGAVREWNSGRVLVVEGAAGDAFCDALCETTLIEGLDRHDDDADGLSSCCYAAGFHLGPGRHSDDSDLFRPLKGRSLFGDFGGGQVLVDTSELRRN